MRNISTGNIVKPRIKFFTKMGQPKTIQMDQGSSFMSRLFKQVTKQLEITLFRSSAYHPQSQGALERFHSTLKNMLRTYCLNHQQDQGIPFVMFAARETVQESLGFSSFELVFGLGAKTDEATEGKIEDDINIGRLDYISKFS